ncbi:MAG: hypothetical protein LKKZDAJK_001850 [Candidatus Fervidibacter sp.]
MKEQRRRRRWVKGLPFVAGLLALALTAVMVAEQKVPSALRRWNARYVGSQVCMECHHEVARVWASLPHSQWMLDAKLPTHSQGCEACHGPGSLHVVARKGYIVAWEKLSVAEQNAICLQCHQTVTTDKWHASPHSGRQIGSRQMGNRQVGGREMGTSGKGKRRLPACTDCHEVHLPVQRRWMLKANSSSLCLRCHADITQKARQGEHHPLDKTQCAACHDAHDGTVGGMLKAEPLTLCDRCHQRSDILPADHTAEFRKAHGKQFSGGERRCIACHGRNGCDRCHGLPMPHPKGFAVHHTEATRAQPSTCQNCHDQNFCAKCHADAPPVSHDAPDYASVSHAKEFRQFGNNAHAYCTTCHQPHQCDDCHRQKGIPLEVRR